MFTEIIIAALFYSVTAIYGDGSCLTMTFRADGDCRVGAAEVWCPESDGPCEARDHMFVAATLYPTCQRIDRTKTRESKRSERTAKRAD